MSPGFRRLVKRSALVAASLALFLMGLRTVLNYQPPCDPPCRRLSPAGKNANGVSFPRQQPLELILELDKPMARANSRFTLHYKVEARNLSDSKLTSVNADFFLDQKDLFLGSRRDFYFRVWDPSGKELEPLPQLGEKDGTIPYDLDLGVIEARDRYVTLDPGGVLRLAPSVLRPFRYEVRWYETRSAEGLGTSIVKGKVPVRAKGWPAPAPGFRVLDGYRFEKPGKYRIQAVYEKVTSVKSIYPAWSALPNKLRPVLWLLKDLGIDVTPPRTDNQYALHSESKILDFEVAP